MKKKIKSLCICDWLFVLILLFPIAIPLLFMLFWALGNSGATTSIDYNSINSNLITYFRSVFNNFNNIFGMSTFNDWFVTNVMNLNLVNVSESVDIFVLFPLLYCEYFVMCSCLKLVVEFLMLLPNIVQNFIEKMGGGY